LRQLGADIVAFQKFRDHHIYDESDMNDLKKLLEKRNGDTLVTTEKDWVKLPRSEGKDDSILAVPVETVWLDEGEVLLREALRALF
jgi:tetraacyldisaccharide-1-P 4'-kinase